jgi:hypothetical protein
MEILLMEVRHVSDYKIENYWNYENIHVADIKSN